MHLVFYVPGMPFNGESIGRGLSLGGSESAGYYLARELATRGHRVTVFCNLPEGSPAEVDGVRYEAIGPVSEQRPLGARFQSFAAAVPHDVLIAQRHPLAFAQSTAAKLHLWWTHDLALKRQLPAVHRQLWNVDAVLAVSQWHGAQMREVYELKEETLAVLPNGLPPEWAARGLDAEGKRTGGALLYTSRPERGLIELLGGDGRPGIMELLGAKHPELRLRIFCYDNTTAEMAAFYAGLQQRARELPNVDWIGPVGKSALRDEMRAAALHVYPTAFEETSCITAMEEQACGTPFLTSPIGALPETLSGGGVHWIALKDGAPDRDAFAAWIPSLLDDAGAYGALHKAALRRAADFTWAASADALEATIDRLFAERTAEPARLARHCLHLSDIKAAQHVVGKPRNGETVDPLLVRSLDELAECYGFAASKAKLKAHYAAYFDWEVARGTVFGPEPLAGNSRFEAVAQRVAVLSKPGARVLDYGCAHGHYTVNLAKRFPDRTFVGIDVAARNIATAEAWAAEEKLGERCSFRHGDESALKHDESFDLVIAAEVLEHVPDPAGLADRLAAHLAPEGRMIVTTPYGPWEAQVYRKLHPWRFHLHHFEEADLQRMFGRHPGYTCQVVPAGPTRWGTAVGSYVTTWRRPSAPSHLPDLRAKLKRQAPRETLSACLICRKNSDTLAKTLRTLVDVVDEIRIAVTEPGEGNVRAIAADFRAVVIEAPNPREAGFAAARNASIAGAAGDWILWIDDDEVLLWPERLPKYLRANLYDAYAVPQHHFAIEPGGVLKTDFPCRLFRNRRGFEFFGLVHEHPELGFNGGAGKVMLLPDVAICHDGYVTEQVRRQRFERNLPLMRRDREENPDRVLGRFLWIRDLMHLVRFEAERNGGQLTPEMHAHAREALELWRGLLKGGHTRLAVDSLPYASEAANATEGPNAVDFQLSVGLHRLGLGDNPAQAVKAVTGRLPSADDVALLNGALLKDHRASVEGKYL